MRNYHPRIACIALAFLFISISISPSGLVAVAEESGDEASATAAAAEVPTDGGGGSGKEPPYRKIFAFGDSYTDTGNAKILGGLQPFVGAILNKMHNRALLGLVVPDNTGPVGPGNGLCNGKLVIDYLCEKLNLPPLPPFKNSTADFCHGANFAIAGTTALSTQIFEGLKDVNPLMFKGDPATVQTQVDWFNDFAHKLMDKVPQVAGNRRLLGDSGDVEGDDVFGEDTLFWVGELGGNDYARIFGTPVSGKLLANESVAHVTRLIENLLGKGAKYMIIQGLPPLGCLPSHLSASPPDDRDQYGCAKTTNHFVHEHNSLLQKKVEEIKYTNGGKCTIMFADYWKAFLTILQDPAKFGFNEPFKACCGAVGANLFNFKPDLLCGVMGTESCQDPDKYIHWDGVHFTEAMNSKLADLFFHQQGYVNPDFGEIVKKKGVVSAKAGGDGKSAQAQAAGDGKSAQAEAQTSEDGKSAQAQAQASAQG